MNIAVILAGGIGKRFGSPVPKQFLPLAGKTVIEYSIDTFCQHPAIDEVAVVVHPDYRDEIQAIADRRGWAKLRRIVGGGTERYMSSLNAIRAYADCQPSDNLLLHDAARPLVTPAIIDRVLSALESHGAVGVGLQCTDTIWEVEVGQIESIPQRSRMWRAQTPQAFSLKVLREAYDKALEDPHFLATDDCGVVNKYLGTPIFVVEGDERNFKITNAEDLSRANILILNS